MALHRGQCGRVGWMDGHRKLFCVADTQYCCLPVPWNRTRPSQDDDVRHPTAEAEPCRVYGLLRGIRPREKWRLFLVIRLTVSKDLTLQYGRKIAQFCIDASVFMNTRTHSHDCTYTRLHIHIKSRHVHAHARTHALTQNFKTKKFYSWFLWTLLSVFDFEVTFDKHLGCGNLSFSDDYNK